MGIVYDLLKDVALPDMVPIRQSFDGTHIPEEEIPAVVREQLLRPEIAAFVKPGMHIAITVGSRGVAHVALITKAIVDTLKSL